MLPALTRGNRARFRLGHLLGRTPPFYAEWHGRKSLPYNASMLRKSARAPRISRTQAEFLYGVALLPLRSRRAALIVATTTALDVHFLGRILPFDTGAAEAFAAIAAGRRETGRPMSLADAQIIAIAKSRGATPATRNIVDFDDIGITFVNPWHVSP